MLYLLPGMDQEVCDEAQDILRKGKGSYDGFFSRLKMLEGRVENIHEYMEEETIHHERSLSTLRKSIHHASETTKG